MSESRICPVCGEEIPIYSKRFCPNCGLLLENMHDEEVIERIKNNFPQLKQVPELKIKREPIPLVYYFITGILGSIIITFSHTMWMSSGNIDIDIFIFSLFFIIPGGFLSGYIVYRLDKSAIFNFSLRVFNILLAFLLSLFLSSFFASILRVVYDFRFSLIYAPSLYLGKPINTFWQSISAML